MNDLEKYTDSTHRLAVANGLMLAQIMARRRYMDAFDRGHGATEIVAMICQDIAEAMQKIADNEDLTNII